MFQLSVSQNKEQVPAVTMSRYAGLLTNTSLVLTPEINKVIIEHYLCSEPFAEDINLEQAVKGKIVIELGSEIGLRSLVMTNVFKAKHVTAFDANSRFRKLAQEQTNLNAAQHVIHITPTMPAASELSAKKADVLVVNLESFSSKTAEACFLSTSISTVFVYGNITFEQLAALQKRGYEYDMNVHTAHLFKKALTAA